MTEIRLDLPDRLHRFLAGHRLVVQVQSTWFPVVDRKPHRCVDIYEADEDDHQKAVHLLYRTAEHPSHITARVLDPQQEKP